MPEDELIMFTGTECTHCHEMEPLVQKLEKELKMKVQRLEVWHNEANSRLMMELARGRCMGIPMFYNKKTDQLICGNTTYEKLKLWAKGEKTT